MTETAHTMKKLATPLAREVAELLLLKSDLEGCIEGFKLYGSVSENRDDPKQARAALSLFRDSVIQLVACFDNANAYNLNAEVVYAHIENGTAYFKWIRDLRDTWIAHRIGPARLGEYGFIIHRETGEIIGEGPFVMTAQAPDKNEARQLVHVSQVALDHVEVLISDKAPALRAEVEAIHPSTRKKLPDAILGVAGGAEVRMGRRKFRNIFDRRVAERKKSRDVR